MKSSPFSLKHFIPYSSKNQQWVQVVILIIVSSVFTTAGSLAAWTSPSIPILTSNQSHIEPITINEASYLAVVSLTALAVASPFLAVLTDYIGRQKMLVLMSSAYFISWVLIIVAEDIVVLYISRITIGIGDAAFFNSVPVYIGEVLEPNLRSYSGSLLAFNMLFGQFLVNLMGSFCSIRTTGVSLLWFPFIQTIVLTFVPESPYFFLIKGKRDEAKMSLKKLRWTDNVDEELNAIEGVIKQQLAESGTLKDIFIIPANLKAFLIIMCLRLIVQLSGLPAFTMFTQYMFQQTGTDFSATTSSIIYYGAFVVIIIPSVFIVGRFGRKPLMTVSCFGCGISLSIVTAYLYMFQNTNIDTSSFSWTPIAGMLLFIVSSSTGLILLPNVILGELFSASIKSKAVCFTSIFFAIYAVGVVKLFQTLTEAYGMYFPFFIFAVNCFLGALFCFCILPETRGKTLGQIQDEMKGVTSKSCDIKV